MPLFLLASLLFCFPLSGVVEVILFEISLPAVFVVNSSSVEKHIKLGSRPRYAADLQNDRFGGRDARR